MPLVTVDGVPYVPESSDSKPLVAIAITTRNRPDVLAQTLKHIESVTPTGFFVCIVDDASSPVINVKTKSSGGSLVDRIMVAPSNIGIPAAKNACLDMCMQSGADHFFLLDDDCYPALENWWKPYVNSPEPHYNYIFTHWSNGQPVGDCVKIYDDGKLAAYDQARGCAMYVHRSAVEKVGGFNLRFGHGMNEHLEYSQRINNAGLTTFAYQDIPYGDDLWYSLDRAQSVTRTLPSAERSELLRRNNIILKDLQGSTDYVEYRNMGNLVVTQLLTSGVDGQRGHRWEPDTGIIATWRESIKGADKVVITDQIDSGEGGDGCRFVKMPTGWGIPHLQRWASTLAYLNDQLYTGRIPPKWLWLTDGSDVEMLNEPWDHMQPGILYVGDEPCTISKEWLAQHHPFYREWIMAHPNKVMLNCGVVGGDYRTVMEFLRDMVRELARAFGQIDYEMGSFNYLLRQHKWNGRVEYGPHVTTQFKANESSSAAWFKHK